MDCYTVGTNYFASLGNNLVRPGCVYSAAISQSVELLRFAMMSGNSIIIFQFSANSGQCGEL